MRLYIGITDINWYRYLSEHNPEDINFWRPGGNSNFKSLSPGGPFLFKLKSPINKIVGIGFFSTYTKLPMNSAWEYFGDRNGSGNYEDFKRMILDLRNDQSESNPQIGCIILTNPIFFHPDD